MRPTVWLLRPRGADVELGFLEYVADIKNMTIKFFLILFQVVSILMEKNRLAALVST